MSQPIHFTSGTTGRTTATGGPRTGQRLRAPSSLLVPLDPMKFPVYAGDLGPGTWVVEVPSGVVPVRVPPDAIAVLAGLLAPHTYVTPVRIVRPPADRDHRLGTGPALGRGDHRYVFSGSRRIA